jgi:hypothetical protein
MWSWPNVRYCPQICSEVLRKITTMLNQDSWSPDQDLNLGPPEYLSGVLTTRPQRRSVGSYLIV